MFENRRITTKVAAFISIFTLLLPDNFTKATKRYHVKSLSSDNFTNKRKKRLSLKKVGINNEKDKNSSGKIVKLKSNTSLGVQNRGSDSRKFTKISKRFLGKPKISADIHFKKQNQSYESKKTTQNSRKIANGHKLITDASLKTQNSNYNLKKIAQTTNEFVKEHKVPVGIASGTIGLFTANRIYNLKKYHKKLPLATKLICNSSLFQLHFLNVGEGDCILVRYNDGSQFHNWLVDVGYNLGFGLTDVTQYLKKLDIKNLDGIVLTHPHPDHYWNLKYVFNEFKVEKFYHSYMDQPVKLIDKINSLSYSTRVTQPMNEFNGDKIDVATEISNLNQQPYTLYKRNNFSIKALGPLQKHEDVNDNSIVLLIAYEDKKFLLMGDAGIEAEKELMSSEHKDTIKNVTMVKIGHHGNNSSSSKEFVKYTNPKIAVCSTGGHFVSFGLLNVHEQPWVMNRWKSCSDGKCEILTTEEQNNIVVYYDNLNKTIKSARFERNAKDRVA